MPTQVKRQKSEESQLLGKHLGGKTSGFPSSSATDSPQAELPSCSFPAWGEGNCSAWTQQCWQDPGPASASAGYRWFGSTGQPSACTWQAVLSVWLMSSQEVTVTLKSVQDWSCLQRSDWFCPSFGGKAIPSEHTPWEITANFCLDKVCLNASFLGLTR